MAMTGLLETNVAPFLLGGGWPRLCGRANTGAA